MARGQHSIGRLHGVGQQQGRKDGLGGKREEIEEASSLAEVLLPTSVCQLNSRWVTSHACMYACWPARLAKQPDKFQLCFGMVWIGSRRCDDGSEVGVVDHHASKEELQGKRVNRAGRQAGRKVGRQAYM